MPADSATRHVVVVGGGVIGVSVATHLQRNGAAVTLLTEGELASGASGRSLSWLNSAGMRSTAYHALRMAGVDRYRTLFAQDPSRDWLRFDGGLRWTHPDDRAALHRRHTHERSHGYDSRLVDGAAAARLAPGLDVCAVGTDAVFNAGEGWVSLPHLIGHLVDEFTTLGGRLHTNAGRASVRVVAGRARGVTTSTGASVDADDVVLACGAGTPAVAAELGVHIEDGSPLSMLVTTEPVPSTMRTVLNTPRVAMRPEPGGGFVLDHDWYESEIVEDEDGTCSIDESVIKELLEEAAGLLDGIHTLDADSWKLGRKPVPGDGEPVFGQLEKVPGCYVAFTHSGATLALIAGELVAHELVSQTRHPMLEPFRPERFTVARKDPR